MVYRSAMRAIAKLIGVLSAAVLLQAAAWADEAGAKLAQAVFDRPTGRDVTTSGKMELIEGGRAPRVRELVTYRLVRGGGESSVLLRFLEPPDIAGTGLLSVDRADGGNEQWLYLPALDRVRRVAGDRKGGRFVGSDIYFEDLQERKPVRDTHRIIGKETLAGTACDILESVPVDAASSVYRKRVSWVDPATALVHRVDYYEKDDKEPSKRWLLVAKKQIQGYWTVTESRMTDLATGHQTRVTIDIARYDRRLPAKLFGNQALADENIESEFRP